MFHNHSNGGLKLEEFVALGTDAIAYVREISGSEIHETFSQEIELDDETTYWGLFAADGQPLMFSDRPDQVLNNAFYNDLKAVLTN